jgi:14-3-3 protein
MKEVANVRQAFNSWRIAFSRSPANSDME